MTTISPLKVFHLADLHLGLTFNNYPKIKAKALEQARFETLRNCVTWANVHKAQILLIAGDLFDKIAVREEIIFETVEILHTFNQTVVILPGNHDYYPSPLWDSFLRFSHSKDQNNLEATIQKILLLTELRPYNLFPDFKLPVIFYPGPCNKRHSKDHALSWLKDFEQNQTDPFFWHVGCAHGSLSTENALLKNEGRYFDMDPRFLFSLFQRILPENGSNNSDSSIEQQSQKFPLWLMGHHHKTIHIQSSLSKKEGGIFFPGVTEADGLDCKGLGKAFCHQLITNSNEGSKKTIETEIVTVGTYQFLDIESLVSESITQEDHFQHPYLDSLAQKFQNQQNQQKIILRLKLIGQLPQKRIQNVFTSLKKRFETSLFHFILDESALEEEIELTTFLETIPKDSLTYQVFMANQDQDLNTILLQEFALLKMEQSPEITSNEIH